MHRRSRELFGGTFKDQQDDEKRAEPARQEDDKIELEEDDEIELEADEFEREILALTRRGLGTDPSRRHEGDLHDTTPEEWLDAVRQWNSKRAEPAEDDKIERQETDEDEADDEAEEDADEDEEEEQEEDEEEEEEEEEDDKIEHGADKISGEAPAARTSLRIGCKDDADKISGEAPAKVRRAITRSSIR